MLRFSVASSLIARTFTFRSERQCSVFCAISASDTPLSQQVNGYAPFFRAFFGVFSDIERLCSVFQADFNPIFDSKVGGLNRSKWVGMLRFHQCSEIPNKFSSSIGVNSMNIDIMSICPKLTKFFG